MTTTLQPALSRRPGHAAHPVLALHEHREWRRLIVERCGLDFGELRRDYLARRLWRRMLLSGVDHYSVYLNRVRQDPREWHELLELLVNRETSFFRHPPSFDALRLVLSEILDRRAGEPLENGEWKFRLDLWSAGCSTGQEAYSLAIRALDSVAARRVPATVKVRSGDVSSHARELTREGTYTERQIAGVPATARRLYFQRQETTRGPVFRARLPLLEAVEPSYWNLVQPSTYPGQELDVIFCQNLLIYLPREQRDALVGRLADCLRPGGYLFLAPGEVLGSRFPGLENADLPDCLAYRRTG